MSREVLDEEIISMLEKSKMVVGEAYPVLVDYDGEVLSGRHRKKAGWTKEERVDTRELAKKWNVTPEMAKLMVKAHMNIQRRVSREETEGLVLSMARELVKMGVPKENVASELRKHLPLSDSYLLELLPPEYKKPEKTVAGMISGEVRRQTFSVPLAEQTVKTQETRIVTCERCHVSTNQPKNWRGHTLCPVCYEKAENNPEAYETFFRYLERAKTTPIKPVKPEVWRPTAIDKWEHRAAQMHPQVSTFEVKFSVEAAKAGLPQGESNVPVCVVQTCPDKTYHLPKGDLYVYFDGPPHKGREDRDEALREQLQKRGATVLSITYEEPTDEAIQEAIEQVKAELLRLGWTPPKE